MSSAAVVIGALRVKWHKFLLRFMVLLCFVIHVIVDMLNCFPLMCRQKRHQFLELSCYVKSYDMKAVTKNKA